MTNKLINKWSRIDAGFTLIELLVVLVILGLLATVAAPRVLTYLGSARSDTGQIQIAAFTQALELYRLDVGRYPADDEGLNALLKPPSGVTAWGGPYLGGVNLPDDPWGNPYIYRLNRTSEKFDLYSLGADNRPGGSSENASVGTDSP